MEGRKDEGVILSVDWRTKRNTHLEVSHLPPEWSLSITPHLPASVRGSVIVFLSPSLCCLGTRVLSVRLWEGFSKSSIENSLGQFISFQGDHDVVQLAISCFCAWTEPVLFSFVLTFPPSCLHTSLTQSSRPMEHGPEAEGWSRSRVRGRQ